jgi:hypothetical protein
MCPMLRGRGAFCHAKNGSARREIFFEKKFHPALDIFWETRIVSPRSLLRA